MRTHFRSLGIMPDVHWGHMNSEGNIDATLLAATILLCYGMVITRCLYESSPATSQMEEEVEEWNLQN